MGIRFTPLVLALAVAAAASVASASMLSLATEQSVLLAQGDQLEFGINIANFALANPGSPLPTQIRLEALAQPETPDDPVHFIPGSTAQYFGGYELQATLAPAKGGAGQHFLSNGAIRAGFDGGTLLLQPATSTVNGEMQQVGVIEGTLNLDDAEARAIFGASGNGDATLWLNNVGRGITLGGGNGYSLRTSLSFQTSGAPGSTQTTGIVESAELGPTGRETLVPTPEPATWWMLFAGILAVIGYYHYRNHGQIAVGRTSVSVHSGRDTAGAGDSGTAARGDLAASPGSDANFARPGSVDAVVGAGDRRAAHTGAGSLHRL